MWMARRSRVACPGEVAVEAGTTTLAENVEALPERALPGREVPQVASPSRRRRRLHRRHHRTRRPGGAMNPVSPAANIDTHRRRPRRSRPGDTRDTLSVLWTSGKSLPQVRLWSTWTTARPSVYFVRHSQDVTRIDHLSWMPLGSTQTSRWAWSGLRSFYNPGPRRPRWQSWVVLLLPRPANGYRDYPFSLAARIHTVLIAARHAAARATTWPCI